MKKAILVLFTMTLGLTFVISDFQPAYAQQTEYTLDEIVVTAQKREQQLKDVPISITVTTADTIERQKIYTLQDLARTTPGLEFGDPTDIAAPGGAGTIRGIGNAIFVYNGEASVGVVVDGVSAGSVNIGNMFDVERVEVLRGPQGTLFGTSASAGVIQIISASPDVTGFHAKVGVDATKDGTLGSDFGRQQLRAMANIPVSEKSALRITGNWDHVVGVSKDAYNIQDRLNKNVDFRGRYLYKGSEDFSINLISSYAIRASKGVQMFTPGPETINPFTGLPENPLLGPFALAHGVHLSWDNQYTIASMPQHQRTKRYGSSAEVDWKMAGHNFVSITGWEKNIMYPGAGVMLGLDAPPLAGTESGSWGGSTRYGRNMTQEFRISSPTGHNLDYVGGLFYGNEKHWEDWAPSYPPPPPQYNFDDTTTTVTQLNYAAFGDVNYAFTDAFKAFAGLREQKFVVKMIQDDLTVGMSYPKKTSTTALSYRLGGQYNINKDVMLYTSASSATKRPVIEFNFSNPAAPPKLLKTEVVTSFELGTKAATSDKKTAIDINLFYTKDKNYQTQTCFADPTNPFGGVTCTTENVDHFLSKGVEVNLSSRPIAGLTIDAGYILTIAKYPNGFLATDTVINPALPFPLNMVTVIKDLGGEQMINTPRHKITFNGEYGKPVTEKLYGFFSIDAVYKSERRLLNSPWPECIYPSFWMFGSNIGIRDIEDKWSVTLFGRNLNDKHEPYSIWTDHQNGAIFIMYNEQAYRQVGISVNVSF